MAVDVKTLGTWMPTDKPVLWFPNEALSNEWYREQARLRELGTPPEYLQRDMEEARKAHEERRIKLANEAEPARIANMIANYTPQEAYENIKSELIDQRLALKKSGVYDQIWRPGVDENIIIDDMASRLANSGVQSIKDLQIGSVPGDLQVIGNIGEDQIFGPGPARQALINTRTGQAIDPQYAFADIGAGGSTWGGTFAGPGSTRYTIDFVNGVPVFGAQQQATVKSGLDKIAGPALGALATYLSAGTLGPVVAGALGGGVSGLISSGDIEGALKGAALGGAGGYLSGLIGGAPISESLPTSFGVGMPFDEAITAAQAAELAGMAGITPGMAAPNLGLLEASMGTPSVATGALQGATVSGLPDIPLSLDVIGQPPVQPALGNLDKAMLLSDAGYGGIGPPAPAWWQTVTPDIAAYNLGQIEGSMGPFVGPPLPTEFVGPRLQTGNADKAALLSDTGYGPLPDQTVTQAPITSSPITTLGPAATAKDVIDYLTGGGFAGVIGDKLTDTLKGLLGGGATTQTQQGGFGGLAGAALGALLSNKGQAAPQAGVSAGKAPDIVSPLTSLLAPKLVQRQPISLL